VGEKSTEAFIDSILILTTRAVAMFLPIKNVEERKMHHDEALSSYQVAYKYTPEQNFTYTSYAFKLYNQAYPDQNMIPPKSPSSLISISGTSSRKMVNSCSWALGRLL